MIRVSEIASSPRTGSAENPGARIAIDLRHEQPCDHQQHDLRAEQQGKNAVGEQLRRFFASAVQMGIGRHERGVERAFGKDRAEVIGQPQRHEERVGHRSRAEDRREHDVARKAGQPREQGIAADGENASEHPPLLQHAAALQNGEIRNFWHDLIRKPETTFRDHAVSAPRTALMIRSCVASSR